MTAQVFSFLRRSAAPCDWSAQELAEFYRIESALIQAGLQVVSVRGLTDEAEPWFVFCREEDDEVIIHFARIDGRYLISSPAYCGTVMGHDFHTLVRRTIERHPMLQPRPRNDNLFLHPAALLIALVASAFLKSGHAAEATPARAATASATDGKQRDTTPAIAPASAAMAEPDAQHETLILAAITAAIVAPVQAEPVTIVVHASAHLADFVDQLPKHPIRPALLDIPENATAHGSGGVTQAPPPIAVPQMETAPSALAHIVAQPDATLGLVFLGGIGPVAQTAPLSMALPLQINPGVNVPALDPASAAQHLPLAALSSISKADLSLLHALGAPDNVAYAATLPAAFSTMLQIGVHTGTVNSAVAHTSSAEASTAPTAVEPEAAQGSTSAAHAAITTTAPAAVATTAPDMSAVLAAVQQFQAVEIQPVLVLTVHAAIFYDAAAVDTNFGAVKSVTYDFGDGFSVSLVGLPAELSHVSVHV